MGCHTWFYKRLDPQPTYQEIKTEVLSQMQKDIDYYDEMIAGELDTDIMDAYPEWTPEYGELGKSVIQRKIRMVEKELCKSATYRYYTDIPYFQQMIFYEGDFYVTYDSLPHDLFRVDGFPDNKLLSLEETLDFIDHYKVKRDDELEDELRKFWLENPNGLIKFG